MAATTDAEITRATSEDPDAAPLDDWLTNATLVLPEPKRQTTLRLDAEVLAWFRAQGPGYQTRINAVLRQYMAAQRRR